MCGSYERLSFIPVPPGMKLGRGYDFISFTGGGN